MPVAIVESPIVDTPQRRKRFTRTEVERMLQAGLLSGQRFELLDGDLIDKMGQNPPHARAIQRCMEIFSKLFGFSKVRGQSPIEVASGDQQRNEPEPDVAILLEEKEEYDRRHPNGSEAALVVEVADSSIGSDLKTKRSLYGRAGVREYWVLDLNERRLVVHRGLDETKGEYASVQSYAENELVEVGGQMIAVSAMLP